MRKKLESIKAKQKQKGHVYEMKQLQKRELIGMKFFFVFGYAVEGVCRRMRMKTRPAYLN